jgi:hypothetical protein
VSDKWTREGFRNCYHDATSIVHKRFVKSGESWNLQPNGMNEMRLFRLDGKLLLKYTSGPAAGKVLYLSNPQYTSSIYDTGTGWKMQELRLGSYDNMCCGEISTIHDIIKFTSPAEYAFIDGGTPLHLLGSCQKLRLDPVNSPDPDRLNYEFVNKFSVEKVEMTMNGRMGFHKANMLQESVQLQLRGDAMSVVKTYDSGGKISGLEIVRVTKSQPESKETISFLKVCVHDPLRAREFAGSVAVA